MHEDFLKNYQLIKDLNVSRETCIDFEQYISLILDENRKINIISKKNANKEIIRTRHIMDSSQIVDFVNLNYNTTYDLGSGAGFPGIVLAIMLKNIKKDMKFVLIEKSFRKSEFLKLVSEKLNLNTEIIQKDIFKLKNLKTGTIVSRAFKPLPILLDLINNNFRKYKNIILFMGTNGKKILNLTQKNWKMEFIKKESLTSSNSFFLNIEKIKKLT